MRAVVVTGASSGIGRACALTLAARDFRVYAGVRNPSDGAALRDAARHVEPVHIDVTDADSIAAMTDKVARETGDAGLAGLVNNAGTTLPCPIQYLPVDAFRRQLEVNLTGPLAVTASLLPLLARGRGRVVNVSWLASERRISPRYSCRACGEGSVIRARIFAHTVRSWKSFLHASTS